MNMYDIIYKKREGNPLTKEEICFFVEGYTDGTIPDYQASALLMAICLKKMNNEETYQLTTAMKKSGDIVDLSGIKGIKVDKHSTGGVGDKTTLIVGPLAAACGVPIAKMSGRGLGFTGGTIDKMESIPGFQTTIDEKVFIDLVNHVGLSVIGQTAHIAPADKKIYALRDVTATVENLSLITSSVMSKKLASGSDAIVLDVKCGKGAFMETRAEAKELGELMVDIGYADGKKTIALVTDMSQPLGRAVGNSNEVIEAIETLKGKGPEDITELALQLASYMIYMGGKATSEEEGYSMAKEVLNNGSALEKLGEFIQGQGGDRCVVDDYSLFPQPAHVIDVVATGDLMNGKIVAYISEIDARVIGLASQHTGAGRATKEDKLDLSAGIYLHKKCGDEVREGMVLASVYAMDLSKVEKGSEEVIKGFFLSEEKPDKMPIVLEIVQR